MQLIKKMSTATFPIAIIQQLINLVLKLTTMKPKKARAINTITANERFLNKSLSLSCRCGQSLISVYSVMSYHSIILSKSCVFNFEANW